MTAPVAAPADTTSSSASDEGILVGHVDALERALAEAFRSHRYRVEEILEDHMEAMLNSQTAHQQELAKLRAENALLRERLSLSPAATQLPQAYMYEQTLASIAKAGAKAKTAHNRKERDTLCDDQAMPTLRKAHNNNKNAPLGSWQPFVAWVPAGASLQAPQPWQPLSPDQLSMQCLSSMRSNTAGFAPYSTGKNKRNHQDMFNILPGAICEDYTGRHAYVGDGEDSDSPATNGDAKKYRVSDVFVATEEEITLSRQNIAAHRKENNQYVKKYAQGRFGGGLSVRGSTDFFGDVSDRPWFIVHPHSFTRIAWDFCSLALVIYDMITIPMEVFGIQENVFLTFMEWVTRLFWTSDMAMSSLTGVIMTDGSVQFELGFIFKRYLKTWLGLDTFIVFFDWMELIADGASGAGIFGKMSRIFRNVRVARLLRLVRMREVMEQISERIQSDHLSLIFTILKLLVAIVSIAHILACIWWAIGDQDDPHSWVMQHNYQAAPLGMKYLVSMHWALCQFTGGMDEITPYSVLERFYSVACWVFAFMVAAMIVSILTSSLTQLHIISGTRARQFSMLRKYLKQNSISSNLVLRMQRSARNALSADLTADLIELLPIVPEPLRAEMHFEMYSVALRNNDFFTWCISDSPQVVRRICHYAMTTALLSNSDVVFSEGESPSEPKAYIVMKGTLDYRWDSVPIQVSDKTWVAEAALWTASWRHVGTLTATSDAKLFTLDVKGFQDIASSFNMHSTVDVKVYASDFVHHLNSTEAPNDLSTLGGTNS
mmetsp:Transcript_78769/g.197927  ORF Transcript_78769/g.197927 Transcript_78769/m.197927 type:complete len:773 (+) Transcript_78769:106-2424(+)